MLKGSLALSTIRTSLVLGLRLVVLALTLWLLARVLGPARFGGFASAAALAVMMGALSNFGTHLVLLGEVSREPSRLQQTLIHTVPTTLVAGALLLGAYLCIVTLILPQIDIPFPLLVALGVAELLLQPLLLMVSMVHQAASRAARSQLLMVVPLLLRLGVVACAVLTADPLYSYVLGYLAASMIALLVATASLENGWPPIKEWRLPAPEELRHAAGFALISLTNQGTAEADKVMLPRLLTLQQAGIYASASRVVAALTLPVAALMISALPRLFRAGSEHSATTNRLLRWIYSVALLYGAAVAVALWYCAPLLEQLFGTQFLGMAETIKWLLIAVPGMILRLVAGAVILALGKPWMRAAFELGGLITLACAAIALTPRLAVQGMTLAVAIGEWTMALTGLALIVRLRRAAFNASAPYSIHESGKS